MSLSALPTALLVPPVNLVPVALAGLLCARWRPRLGYPIAVSALVGLLLLGMPVVSLLLADSLQTGLPRTRAEAVAAQNSDTPAPARPGAIIVLSADGSSGGAGGILPSRGLGLLTLERLQAGATLARETGLPLLLTGGVVERDNPPIATLMGESLVQDFGLNPRWIESNAADTWENALFSAAMLRASGVRGAYLVTDAWHMRRALIAFRHAGFEVIPLASRFEAAPDYEASEFVPRVSAWMRSYFAFHEWIGCVWYEIRS